MLVKMDTVGGGYKYSSLGSSGYSTPHLGAWLLILSAIFCWSGTSADTLVWPSFSESTWCFSGLLSTTDGWCWLCCLLEKVTTSLWPRISSWWSLVIAFLAAAWLGKVAKAVCLRRPLLLMQRNVGCTNVSQKFFLLFISQLLRQVLDEKRITFCISHG